MIFSLGLVALKDTISSPQNTQRLLFNSHLYSALVLSCLFFSNNYMQLDIPVLECGKRQPLILSWYPIIFSKQQLQFSTHLIEDIIWIFYVSIIWGQWEFITSLWTVSSDRVFSWLCFFQVLIQNKKIDLSHVTSKCGSLDNIHHRPGNVSLYWGSEGKHRGWQRWNTG